MWSKFGIVRIKGIAIGYSLKCNGKGVAKGFEGM
jgi:hypothetical protein